MAPWRTSAALALLALVAGGCGHDPSASSTGTTATAARPQVVPVQQQPLTVKGTGFRPDEKVRLSAKGLRSSAATATADGAGEFEATLRGLKSCDSVNVYAVGSNGSRAQFNLSSIACTDG
ncbi:MAG TPA: hypothetical protein VFK71_06520 [Gaiellaceae bacterium]|nr:hypothetical protein [Gaiellaceae bacterium]